MSNQFIVAQILLIMGTFLAVDFDRLDNVKVFSKVHITKCLNGLKRKVCKNKGSILPKYS